MLWLTGKDSTSRSSAWRASLRTSSSNITSASSRTSTQPRRSDRLLLEIHQGGCPVDKVRPRRSRSRLPRRSRSGWQSIAQRLPLKRKRSQMEPPFQLLPQPMAQVHLRLYVPFQFILCTVLTYHSLNRLLLSLHRSQVSHILQEPQHTLLLLTPPGQPLALLAASRRDLQVVARSLRHSRRDLLTRTPVVWPLLASQVLHQSTNLRPMPVEHPVAMISIS